MSSFTSLICLASIACVLGISDHEEIFIGWKGETYSAAEVRNKQSWVQQISWTPRAYLWHNMITEQEAQHLRRIAAPRMRRSTVVGNNGSDVTDDYRTSYGTFIPRLNDGTVRAIMERVAEWTRAPPVNQEDMQILRYGVGQKYSPHTDSLIDESPRMATVLIYLADTEEGGETAFPQGSKWVDSDVKEAMGPMSACTKGHVAVRPRLGDALLFYSIKPDGTHESASMHTGCPVIRGHKWTATVWVHSQPYRPRSFKPPTEPAPLSDPADCVDDLDSCVTWAQSGECDKNPVYMKGPDGHCRASCKACHPCEKGDETCWMRHREKEGLLVYDKATFY